MGRLVVLLLVLLLFLLGVAPLLVVKANPTTPEYTEVAPPSDVEIELTVFSPKEDTLYDNGTINLHLRSTLHFSSSFTHLQKTMYKGDWMEYSRLCPVTSTSSSEKMSITTNDFDITDIPAGEHSITIKADAQGGYWQRGEFTQLNKIWATYTYSKTVTVNFTVHANPIIRFTTPQNTTSTSASFPLNFTVDHPSPELTCCLDGQDRVPISGNITLTGLPNGQHNVTVTAKDAYGYVGTSEPLVFNVDASGLEPPFVAGVVVVAVCGAAVVGLGVYFRRCRCLKKLG
jgi:hypothetical protein